jgi:hypothetical protein
MKKVIWINGVIAGVVVSAMLLISMPLHKQGVLNYDNGLYVGYATMVIALSAVFFGIKTYRDQYENGMISFWSACKIGLGIAVVASIIYALTWEIYYRFDGGGYMENYTTSYLENMRAEGATESELAAKKSEMQKFNEAYENPVVRFAMSLVEILPVGILITLISAALLRKRKFLPAS